MKTLMLVRHAKSSWAEAGMADDARPLNPRGERDAPEMGRRLARAGVRPGRMISSPAARAWMTAERIAAAIGYPAGRIAAEDRLYGAGVKTWLEVIRDLPDTENTIMLFGHNPGITELANCLGTEEYAHVPTCGIVTLEYDAASWRDVADARPVREDFDCPKRKA
jgi:phosphohistidine phosphatase